MLFNLKRKRLDEVNISFYGGIEERRRFCTDCIILLRLAINSAVR